MQDARAEADRCNRTGIGLAQAGRFEEALAQFEQAATADPSFASPLCNAGYVLNALNRHEAALPYLRRAIEISPNFADAHNNHGIALAGLGRVDEAVEAYKRTLALQPTLANAHNNLANSLMTLERDDEAFHHFNEALRRDPRFASAHYNLGRLLLSRGEPTQAAERFQSAIALKPDFAEAHASLGALFADMRRPQEAIDAFTRALELDPTLAFARAQRLHQWARACEWAAIAAELKAWPELGVTAAVPPWAMLSFDDDPAKQLMRAQRFAAERFGEVKPIAHPLKGGDKVRIGYFSADFQTHAAMHLIARVFELHDRSRFEVHAFSFGADIEDPMRARVKSAVDVFHNMRVMSDEAAAAYARAKEIDIAVNLSGYTQGARTGVFARRAAPVQINYMGYPGTMGAPFMDFIIADDVIIPPGADRFYSERVIRLQHCYQPNDDTRAIAATPSSADLGLRERGFVFCSFNNAYKIGPREFDIWMRLLAQVGGSVLWLLAANPIAEANLKREAQTRGVDAERLIFAPIAPPAEHLARMRAADLFLDSFNCNAHTSASDALWAGLPVITKLGHSFAARVCSSLLTAVGLPELITETEDQYAELAKALAEDSVRLGSIRSAIAANRRTSPLFDSAAITRDLEAAYLKAANRTR